MVESEQKSEVTVRLKLSKLWRYRPRLLTVVVVAVIAAMIVLANLTDEISRRGPEVLAGPGQLRFSVRDPGPVDPRYSSMTIGFYSLSYGWPLVWRQYILYFWYVPSNMLGQCYSPGRLALNLLMWVVLLVAPGAACEWLLRRYRPRFRWSLRTLLAAIAVLAAFCGWFAAARNRADLQDAIIAKTGSTVWVERWGPRWLDWIGADRYRRRIVGARIRLAAEDDADALKRNEELVSRLKVLPHLRYIFIETGGVSARTVKLLNGLRQLKVLDLEVSYDCDHRMSDEQGRLLQECLLAIGAMPALEHLSLSGPPAVSESLACLAGLTNLKSLRLELDHYANEESSDVPILSRLPPLPRVEIVDLKDSYVGDRGLRHLAVLPRLKTLNLDRTEVIRCDGAQWSSPNFDPGLAELADLEFLEEVTVAGQMASATGLESLLALKRLKKLHFIRQYMQEHHTAALTLDHGGWAEVQPHEIDRYRCALDVLRRTNPGIVIDSDLEALDWPLVRWIPDEYGLLDDGLRRAVLYSLGEWKNGVRLNEKLWPQPVAN